MRHRKRKAIIDDGMNPELVYGAEFDGYFGIPLIRKPDKFIIPSDIVPFTKRSRLDGDDIAVGFYEMDNEFSDVLIAPEKYVEEFKKNPLITPEKTKLVLSPDCSLYRNAPLQNRYPMFIAIEQSGFITSIEAHMLFLKFVGETNLHIQQNCFRNDLLFLA